MEDFTKMVEAYRWKGGDSGSPPTLTVPCKVGQEKAGSMIGRCSCSKDEEGISSLSYTCSLHINNRSTEPYLANHDVHTHPSQVEARSCVSDDDGVVANRQTLDSAISYSPAWYKPRQSRLCRNKPRVPSRSHSSRQLVFSVEDMDSKHGPEGTVISEGKTKRGLKEKRRQTQTKQRGVSKDAKKDPEVPEIYADSGCEDGPMEFCSPSVSPPSELGNAPPSRKRKRSVSKPNNHLTRHVSVKGKSPFFAHGRETAASNDVKISIKTSSTIHSKPKNQTSTMKIYTRKRKKQSLVSPHDVGVVKEDGINESSSLINECVDKKKHAEHQSACSSKEAVVMCLKDDLSGRSASNARTTSAYFSMAEKALGQRDIANKTWVPPISVHALIQEELYQDPWKVLVACMLLNKTAGKQTQKVIWDLFALCPTPEAAVAMEIDKVEGVIHPLGLQKKRARMIQRFSEEYLGKKWSNVGELHGIGKYATDAYAIFCEGRWQEVKPEDHKLVDYWRYLCATDGLGYAFRDNREKGREAISSELKQEAER